MRISQRADEALFGRKMVYVFVLITGLIANDKLARHSHLEKLILLRPKQFQYIKTET